MPMCWGDSTMFDTGARSTPQEVALQISEGPMPVETKALRYNTGKIRLSLVPPSLNLYTGAVLTYGALKYADHNWAKGFPWMSIVDSLERHLAAFKRGEDHDEESGLPHVAHIACNVAFLIEHYDQGLGVDDRRKINPHKELRWNIPAQSTTSPSKNVAH